MEKPVQSHPFTGHRKMRVLQVIGGSAFGGGTRVILALSRHLRSKGINVILNGSDSTNVELFRESGCDILALPNMRREISPWHDLVWTLRLVQFIRQRRINIVHTHTSKGGWVGRLAASLARVPVILHLNPA